MGSLPFNFPLIHSPPPPLLILEHIINRKRGNYREETPFITHTPNAGNKLFNIDINVYPPVPVPVPVPLMTAMWPQSMFLLPWEGGVIQVTNLFNK